MKKLAFLAACLLTLMLASCTQSEVPYGMQVVADGSDGYLFYAPDNMRVYTGEGFATAYISDVDTTGMVLSFTDIPTGDTRKVEDFYKVGVEELKALPAYTKDLEGTMPVSGKESPFIVYTFEDGETVYKAQTVYTLYGNRCYVFSFTVLEETFANYEKALASTIGYIKYSDTRAENTPFTGYEDEKTPDGMMRVSNPEIADYRFYAPKGYKVVDGGDKTLVYVSDSDKTSFSVFPTIPNATSLTEYLEGDDTKEGYKDSLAKIYQELSIYAEKDSVPFGDRENVYMMEYSGIYRGERYYVRQYFMSPPSGYYIYIFTYTARAADSGNGVSYFEKNLADMEKMAKEFRFAGEE